LTIRPCVHVAVPASLVAEFTDVDLEDRDAGGAERVQARFTEPGLERLTGGTFQDLELLVSRSEGTLAS
jgi:hypothetical protein